MKDQIFNGFVYSTLRGYVKSVEIYWDGEVIYAYVDGELCDDLPHDNIDDFIRGFQSSYGFDLIEKMPDIVSPDKLLNLEQVVHEGTNRTI